MADEEAPEAEPDTASTDEEEDFGERNLFGIDLGRLGDRAEQKSRDEVEPPKPKKEKAAARTLTDRLASAASDRDDAANRSKNDDPEAEGE